MVAAVKSTCVQRSLGRGRRCAVCVALLGAALCLDSVVAIQSQRPAESGAASDKGPKPHDFAPGVRIDWQARVVEVDAKVVFRAGPLELIACAPQTREHESILVVTARPMHIYQALGLIGLEPGHPVRYLAEKDTTEPPTGDRLAVSVRYREQGRERMRPVREWTRLTGGGGSPPELTWVFAGSRTFQSGRFGADADGTVACVVDFDTALIALADLHTSDNAQLWLEANTPEIPPIGTPCTLLIRRYDGGVETASLDRAGRLRCDGAEVTASQLAARVIAHGGHRQTGRLVIEAGADVPQAVIDTTVAALAKHGLEAGRVEIRHPTGGRQDPERGGG